MKDTSSPQKRKGSALFIVGAVIMALFLFFGGFLKYTTRRRHSTGRLNKSFFARELSYSLATLAAHYLKEIEFKKMMVICSNSLRNPLPILKTNLAVI